jgi:hypothetical protein
MTFGNGMVLIIDGILGWEMKYLDKLPRVF